jgi:hypothetical protein
MRTLTIAASLLAAAFTGFAASSASARGSPDATDCGYAYSWDKNSQSCVPNRRKHIRAPRY